jgi:hypothetical protein
MFSWNMYYMFQVSQNIPMKYSTTDLTNLLALMLAIVHEETEPPWTNFLALKLAILHDGAEPPWT